MRYHYYMTRAITEGRPREAGAVRRVPAREVEQIVLDMIAKHCSTGSGTASDSSRTTLDEATSLSAVQRHLRRVEVHGDHLRISLDGAGASDDDRVAYPATGRLAEDGSSSGSMTLTVPWTPPARRPRCEVNLPADPKPHPLQTQIIEQIVMGRRWLQELTGGAVSGVEAIAHRENKHPRSIRSTLSFALLAPAIVERIIDGGALPGHLTLTTIGRACLCSGRSSCGCSGWSRRQPAADHSGERITSTSDRKLIRP